MDQLESRPPQGLARSVSQHRAGRQARVQQLPRRTDQQDDVHALFDECAEPPQRSHWVERFAMGTGQADWRPLAWWWTERHRMLDYPERATVCTLGSAPYARFSRLGYPVPSRRS